MVVDKKIRDKWKLLAQYGDKKKIAEMYGLTRATLIRVMNGDDTTEATVQKIATFFKEREERIKQMTKTK